MQIANINTLKSVLDEAWHHKSFVEIAKAPPSALAGLDAADGQKLMEALDVKTIAELAGCRHVLLAQALAHLAPLDKEQSFKVALSGVLDPKSEGQPLRAIVKASPAVFLGLSEKKAKALAETIQARTVEELATNRFVLIAQALATLARQEKIDSLRQAA
jgi:hypothetical protein